MSQSLYKDGDVVWVKWGTVWWPGEVWSNSRVPEDIITSLRKPVIAFVKFFQEDSFEFVRSKNNISVYNCEKKIEYIKKGMDKYRSNNKVMTNFPADVVKAEQLTGGNTNILSNLEIPTKTSLSKASSSNVGAASNTANFDVVKKTVQMASSPTVGAKKSAGSYNSSVKVQNTTNSVQKPNEKKLTCTMCSFSTDRMNLLMMHIKNHSLTILSRVNSPSSSSSETRRPVVGRNSSKKSDNDDGIAEDVRKIKESMKDLIQQQEQISSSSNSASAFKKKTRTSAAKSTPKVKSQATKREKKSNNANEVKVMSPSVTQKSLAEEKSKIDTHGLKNELLADWLDDDEIGVDKNTEESSPKQPEEIPEKVKTEKAGESSRSIRNIPKKQRVSEMYIQPEPEKISSQVVNMLSSEVTTNDGGSEVFKKIQKAGKRKHVTSDSINEPEKKKLSEETDDNKLLMATTELLNDTEVPMSSDNKELSSSSPSTFHKSNDIDKRYLPPKERNKRIFRAKNSPDLTTSSNIALIQNLGEKIDDGNEKERGNHDENESKIIANDEDAKVQLSSSYSLKIDRQELILPHKKKQSSRLLPTTEKQASLAHDIRSNRELRESSSISKTEQISASARSKRNRKSNDSQELIESNKSKGTVAAIDETSTVLLTAHTPLRDPADANESKPIISQLENTLVPDNRGQKRQRSRDSQKSDLLHDLQSEAKKFHKSDSPQPQLRSVVACSGEAICITSKGTISVTRPESIKTTCANSVVVTSHVIISEAMAKQPIVTTQISTTDTTSSPKKSIVTSTTLPPQQQQQQSPKNALKIPKENIEEMKKQGLVTVENNRTKLTPKGRQKFKEFQDEQSSVSTTSSSSSAYLSNLTLTPTSSSNSIDSQEKELLLTTKSDELQRTKSENLSLITDAQNETNTVSLDDDTEVKNQSEEEKNSDSKEVCEQDENENEKIQNELKQQNNEKILDEDTIESCVENEYNLKLTVSEATVISEIAAIDKQNESTKMDDKDKPTENGKSNGDSEIEKREKEMDVDLEIPVEDASSGGAGLIALQAETFGGPPNCFYLCRPVEGGYEPVDNQILVLNAQNALVPYDGEIITETVQENLAAYSQLSPNSNIIINTPNGQKIELSHYAILTLQEQADENGIASVELSGEQIELNINGILEAIQAQQQQDTSDAGEILGTVLVGEASDVPLIIDSAEASPVEVQIRDPSVSTQVSETLSKPIMSTTVAPEIAINPPKPTIAETASKNINIEDSLASIGVKAAPRANVPKSLELPITVTNPTIAETVNHRKLVTSILGSDIVAESFVVQPTDNGSVDD